jgi:exonuclease VII small subunit
MAQLITERVKNLRNEIAKLNEANRAYLKGLKYGAATADKERRLQRLLEIADELKSLSDWKKP